MKNILAPFALLGLLAVSSVSLYGCEGEAEQAGERIDDATERMGDKIEDATDKK